LGRSAGQCAKRKKNQERTGGPIKGVEVARKLLSIHALGKNIVKPMGGIKKKWKFFVTGGSFNGGIVKKLLIEGGGRGTGKVSLRIKNKKNLSRYIEDANLYQDYAKEREEPGGKNAVHFGQTIDVIHCECGAKRGAKTVHWEVDPEK